MANEQNASGAQVPCISLLAAFDDALNVRPHLVFEVGYTRVTDWMVHVWDSTGVGIGAAPKIVTAQAPDRDEAMTIAAAKLRELFPANAERLRSPASGDKQDALVGRDGGKA